MGSGCCLGLWRGTQAAATAGESFRLSRTASWPCRLVDLCGDVEGQFLREWDSHSNKSNWGGDRLKQIDTERVPAVSGRQSVSYGMLFSLDGEEQKKKQ